MIWHFLKLTFFGTISLIIFVNVWQYSGAILPFDSALENDFNNNTFFGFSSIFTFMSNIGNDKDIANGFLIIKTGIGMIQDWSIDHIVSTFNGIRTHLDAGNNWFAIVEVVVGFIWIFIDSIIMPFITIFSLIIIIIGIVLFAFSFLSVFAKFLLGGYNINDFSSTIGTLPNLMYILPTIVR